MPMATETPTTTSVRVSLDTWRRLTALKTLPGDDFDMVIRRLLDERQSKPQS